ncbi:MAG: hypothetical protein FD136_1915 [Chitinophagaceae bacterium]|nr:MAG: hypothetical protein FD136_1915 [Chitinophagaceae bacterium]
MHHFTWDNDSLVVQFDKQKGDQTGESVTPKHVYANPHEPSICPLLSLALLVFSTNFSTKEDDKTKIFSGCPYDSFTKWLHLALGIIIILLYI